MDLIKELRLDTSEGIARFLVGVGYDRDNIVRGVVEHCGLDRIEAERIVDKARLRDVARRPAAGPSFNANSGIVR